mmetsp:Transcript_25291/g.81789  ORF Transcript_25291/g.81789 Transcript_25291/m.81789 type:complete len:132 (-) Transcript_25291:768-1163(-)
MHGCVPVIVSDDFQPPLEWWLPWREMAIFLPTSALPSLETILRHEAEVGWRKRHELLTVGTRSAAKVLDWRRVDFWALYFYEVSVKLAEQVSSTATLDTTWQGSPLGAVSYRSQPSAEQDPLRGVVSQLLW